MLVQRNSEKLKPRKTKNTYVPVIDFASDLSLFATCVGVHVLAEQTRTGDHNSPLPQTVAPVPDHPESHVTVTLASIIPVIEFVAALSEFGTCVDGQSF